MDGKTIIIAVAGKGGVGKTSLSAVIVKLLVENFPNKRILAIDADPAIGLSTALGIEPKKTIDDVRKETVEQTQNGKISPIEILGNAEYSIEEAICSAKGFDFIADKNNKITEENIYKLYMMAVGDFLDDENKLLAGNKYRHDSVTFLQKAIEE